MAVIDNGKPVHIIINPKCGYGGQVIALGEFRHLLCRAGLDFVEHTATSAAGASKYAASIAGRAAAAVVWGGDGTVHAVINGLAGSDVPLLPCPVGTENILAKELQIPSNPRQLLEVLTGGDVVACDVGRINDQNFMMIIGVGFDGEVVRRVTAGRTGHTSHLSYFWPIWRTFWEHNFPRMTITAEGEKIFDDYALAFIGNVSRYAVGLRICRDAVFDDGLLDLVIFTCREQAHLLLHAAWTLLRRHPLKGNVIYKQVRNVQIETDRPVPCQIDGEMGPSTPLDVSVLDHQVKLIMPRRRLRHGLLSRFSGE